MENASKALIMAAGVLIGILILSLAVYLFITFGSSSAEMHKQIESDRINEFNSQFTSYEGKEDITIYDVISVANLATENNKYYEINKKTDSNSIPSDNYIFVNLKNEGNIEFGINDNSDSINDKYNGIISKELQNNIDLPKYKCKISINDTTRRVYKVEFIKK